MTERRGDPGFTVAPQRLGDGGGRPGRSPTRRIGLALVIAAAAVILTIAVLGPRLAGPPHFDAAFFATPVTSPKTTPSPTSTPFGGSTPATPLPSTTRPDGVRPDARVAIVTDRFHVLDLATGDIATGPPARYARDAFLPLAPGDGWICICFEDNVDTAKATLNVSLVEVGTTGVIGESTQIAAFPSSPASDVLPPSLSSDVDAAEGGHRALLALAAQAGDTWRLSLVPIDVDGRRAGSTVKLATVVPPSISGPSGAPTGGPAASESEVPEPAPIDAYIDGPHLRVSPDGRLAFVWANVQRSNVDGNETSATYAWRVALNPDGSIGAITQAPGLEEIPVYCRDVGFAADDRLAWFCPAFTDDPSLGFTGLWKLETMDLDGQPTGGVDLALDRNGYANTALFDRANGQVYAWDATGLSIHRIDVHSLAVTSLTFDPVAETANGVAGGGGSAKPDWHDGDSAPPLGFATISAEQGGDRLYAIGFDPRTAEESGAQPSRGIFVIDRSTLALVDRWAPAAEYIAVTALPGGLVAGAGSPGVTPDGHGAPWDASVTIHDATDGRVLVRFGQLGSDQVPLVLRR